MASTLQLRTGDDGDVHAFVDAPRPDHDAAGLLTGRTSNDSRWDDLPPGFRALVVSAPTNRKTAEYWMDLSDGSPDRELAAQLVAQKAVRFLWQDDDLADAETLEVSDWTREEWETALRATAGISAAAWAWRVAEAQWAESPSWRPDRPLPSKARLRAIAAGLPEDGATTVAGVALPSGRRLPGAMPAYWASDAAPQDAEADATRLARAFSGGGLWPILWAWDEDPSNYLGGHAESEIPQGLDVATILHAARAGSEEPSLLASEEGEGASRSWRDAPNAFDDVRGERLLLVPCERPSDALHMLDWEAGAFPIALLTVVLRSWERRFAAVPVQLEPSAVTVHFGAPPSDPRTLARLVAEINAVAYEDFGLDSLTPEVRIVLAPREEYPPELMALLP